MNIDIHEFNRLGTLPENIAEYENAYETYQQELDVNSNIVLDSRLSWYNQPKSFKVFLQVGDEIAAQRLLNDTKRFGEAVGNYDMILDLLKKRNQ
jgi:cytidylate kinase